MTYPEDNTLKTPSKSPENLLKIPLNSWLTLKKIPWRQSLKISRKSPENTLKFMTFSTFSSLCPLWGMHPLHPSKGKGRRHPGRARRSLPGREGEGLLPSDTQNNYYLRRNNYFKRIIFRGVTLWHTQNYYLRNNNYFKLILFFEKLRISRVIFFFREKVFLSRRFREGLPSDTQNYYLRKIIIFVMS